MKTSPFRLAAALLAAAAAPAFAAGTVSTSAAAFMASVAPGAYTNSFDGLGWTPPPSFGGNGFSYSISAVDGTYSNGDFIGANEPQEALVVTFTGATVTAVGADFYATSGSDSFAAAPITLTLGDGTTTLFTPGSATDGYRGFTSTVGIRSLTVSTTTPGLYVNLDNLTVGVAAVPEPATGALLAAGLGALAWVARRRSA